MVISKPIATIAQAPEVAESTLVTGLEKQIDKVDEALTEPTSNEATSKDTTIVTIYTTNCTTNSGPTPINFAPPEIVTKSEVNEMIGLAMDNFA